jgi:hypothetical protein
VYARNQSNPVTVDGKVCRMCEEYLPAERFHRGKRSADGLQSACASCLSSKKSQYRFPRSTDPKQCTWCKETRPAADFPTRRSSKDGLFSMCADCHAWQKREEKYGRPRDELIAMWEAGGPPASVPGGCWICGVALTASTLMKQLDRKTVVCIDHCHNTGRVRGVLCQACNQMVANHPPERLRKAAAYVEGDS